MIDSADLTGRIRYAWAMAGAAGVSGAALRSAPLSGFSREVAAIITPEGHKGIFIPLRPGETVDIPLGMKPNATGALKADIAQFSDGTGAAFNALSVLCRDASCESAFISFVMSFLERLSGADLGALLDECHREFRRLIGELPAEGGNRLTGMLGELILVRDLTAVDSDAFRFWAGPRGERHDFRNGNIAVEVKTGLRSESKSEKVTISDWDQLEAPEGGSLYLHVIRLERVDGGEITLGGLLQDIRGRLAGIALESFERTVATYVRQDGFLRQAYSIQRRHTYQVGEGFPRLARCMLPLECLAGISGVSYDLDLSQASAFLYNADATTILINGATNR
jgi:hypothetical protein